MGYKWERFINMIIEMIFTFIFIESLRYFWDGFYMLLKQLSRRFYMRTQEEFPHKRLKWLS